MNRIIAYIKTLGLLSELLFCNFFLRLFLRKPNYDKKYRISLCGIFKNEASFLKEWIEFHRIVGIDHFFLYNNLSEDNYREVLDPYIKNGIVDLIEWPYPQTQMKAYADFLKHYAGPE